MDNFYNSSQPPLPPLTSNGNNTFKVFLVLISTPLIFLTILGNSVVILTWLLKKSIRTPSNLYLASLAVADLITGLFAFPPTVHYSYTQQWAFGLTPCRMWLVMCFMMYTVTAFHLVLISVDRYRTLTEGVHYLQRRSVKSVAEKLVIIWILAFWVTFPVLFDWEHVSRDPTGQKHCVSKKIPYWVAHYCCASFWFPACFLIRTYYKVFQEIKLRLWSRTPRMKSCHEPSTESAELSRDKADFSQRKKSLDETAGQIGNNQDPKLKVIAQREKRSAITVVIISGAFVICWLPWNTLTLFDVLASKDNKPPPYLFMASAIFGLANSCINPIVYAARIPEFRKVVTEFFSKFPNVLKR